MLRPGGRLLVIDLAEHERADLTGKLAHRWPGFADATMHEMLAAAGMQGWHAAADPRAAADPDLACRPHGGGECDHPA